MLVKYIKLQLFNSEAISIINAATPTLNVFDSEEETTDGGIEIKHIAAPDQINPADTDEM